MCVARIDDWQMLWLQLTTIAVHIATDLLKSYNEAESTARIAEAAISGNRDLLDMESKVFATHAGRLLEVRRTEGIFRKQLVLHVSKFPWSTCATKRCLSIKWE